MDPVTIRSVLNKSDRFTVTTEKVIELVGTDRPFTKMVKQSTYNIVTGEMLAARLSRPPVPSWWVKIDLKTVQHKRNGNEYVLAGLDKSGEYIPGGTHFYPVEGETVHTDCPFDKKDVAEWLPPKGDFDETFCLPFNSIEALEPRHAPVPRTYGVIKVSSAPEPQSWTREEYIAASGLPF
jgi:hypothetical protein